MCEPIVATEDVPLTARAHRSSGHLRLRGETDESDVGRVGVGQPAWVTAAAYGKGFLTKFSIEAKC